MKVCDVSVDGELLCSIAELLDVDENLSADRIPARAALQIHVLHRQFGEDFDFVDIVLGAMAQNTGCGRERLACLFAVEKLWWHHLIDWNTVRCICYSYLHDYYVDMISYITMLDGIDMLERYIKLDLHCALRATDNWLSDMYRLDDFFWTEIHRIWDMNFTDSELRHISHFRPISLAYSGKSECYE